MNTHTNQKPLGFVLVLSAALLWGTVGPAQVLAASAMSPVALGGWRLVIGGSMLALIALRHRESFLLLRDRKVLVPSLICAAATGLYQAAFLASVARTGAALATVVTLGIAPAATGIAARLLRKEHLGLRWIVGTGAAVFGCVLLVGPGGDHVDELGLLFAVLGGICYGIYTVFASQVSQNVDPIDVPAVSAFALLAGSLLLLPWSLAESGRLFIGNTIPLVLWLGVVATGVAYWLFTAGVRHVRSTTAGTLSLAEPLAAAVLAVFILHEFLTPIEWAGCAFTFAGMIASSLPLGKPPWMMRERLPLRGRLEERGSADQEHTQPT